MITHQQIHDEIRKLEKEQTEFIIDINKRKDILNLGHKLINIFNNNLLQEYPEIKDKLSIVSNDIFDIARSKKEAIQLKEDLNKKRKHIVSLLKSIKEYKYSFISIFLNEYNMTKKCIFDHIEKYPQQDEKIIKLASTKTLFYFHFFNWSETPEGEQYWNKIFWNWAHYLYTQGII